MMKRCLLPGSLLGCMLAVATPGLAQSTSGFTTFDVPGAGTEAQQGTFVKGIDTAGDVAGTYVDSLGAYHGFLRAANGTFTIINVTDAATTAGQGTRVAAIDAEGNIAGYFTSPSGEYYETQGFVRATDGTITTFIGPNGTGMIEVLGINTGGTVTGADGWVEGGDIFERATDGTGTNFVLAPLSADGSVGIAINTAGEVAGRYKDNNNISHGFVLSANGTTITTFDPPNLATTSTSHGNSGTLPTSIDTAGDIAGTYTDANGARHGFVRTAAGVITTFDAPGADTGPCATSGMGVLICGTGGFAMDDAMDIVGAYVDRNNVSHGFLRSGSTGAITSFDAPGAGTGSYEGTVAFAINAAGTITGMYVDANSVMHGFLFTPAWMATTTTLTPAGGQSQVLHGEPASFNVTVSSSGGAPPNGEMAYLMNGATQLGSAALSAGAASITTTELPGGTDSITAIYGGDASFSGSTSAPVSQPVGRDSSTTTLISSPNPSSFDLLLTLAATVEGQFGGVPTGTVTFSSGSATLGTAPVSGGAAVLTYTALPEGTDAIKSVFSGDSNFTGSTSNTASLVVTGEITHEWTWMGGSSTEGQDWAGVYGVLGVSGLGNIPGDTVGAASWADSSGNFWLFGGGGATNALWKFNPSTNEWAWITGDSSVPVNVVYGTLGTPAAGNTPGGLESPVSWTDASGDFWLFGGFGSATGGDGQLNQLWKFDTSIGQWAWMGGGRQQYRAPNPVSRTVRSPVFMAHWELLPPATFRQVAPRLRAGPTRKVISGCLAVVVLI